MIPQQRYLASRSYPQIAARLLAAVLLAMPISAAADSAGLAVTPASASSPPIEIDECKLLYSGNEVAGVSSGVYIKFTNDAKVAADLVSFKVAAANESAIIRDVGTFTPGIEITHQYKEGSGHPMFSPLLDHVHLDCGVASAHFKDGTTWQPSLPQAPTPASTPTPAPTKAAAGSAAIDLAPKQLAFTGVGPQYDRYISLYDRAGLGSIRQLGTCAGVVSVRTVEMSRRSAALRVSPVGAGRCSITIADAANNAVAIPVSVDP